MPKRYRGAISNTYSCGVFFLLMGIISIILYVLYNNQYNSCIDHNNTIKLDLVCSPTDFIVNFVKAQATKEYDRYFANIFGYYIYDNTTIKCIIEPQVCNSYKYSHKSAINVTNEVKECVYKYYQFDKKYFCNVNINVDNIDKIALCNADLDNCAKIEKNKKEAFIGLIVIFAISIILFMISLILYCKYK
jgi:hypothetical protein